MKIMKHIKDCKDGDIIGEDIYAVGKNIPIAVSGSLFDERLKERLIDNTVFRIFIEEDEAVTEGKKQEKIFVSKYTESVSDVKSIFKKIAVGEKCNVERLASVSRDFIDNSDDIFRVVESMNKVRGLDEYTYTHSLNVGIYSMLIARWLKLDKGTIQEVTKAGMLHDIGKARIPKEILNKTGLLTAEEFSEMKKHPEYGYQLCKSSDSISEEVKLAVKFHHEKLDGSGYPSAIKEGSIGLYSRIVAIADIYDAVTSERVYKSKQTPFDTFKEIKKIAYGKLDIAILDMFLSNISSFYVGAKVKLNTGEIGEVAFIPPYNIEKPVVKLGTQFIDTSRDARHTIEEMI